MGSSSTCPSVITRRGFVGAAGAVAGTAAFMTAGVALADEASGPAGTAGVDVQ